MGKYKKLQLISMLILILLPACDRTEEAPLPQTTISISPTAKATKLPTVASSPNAIATTTPTATPSATREVIDLRNQADQLYEDGQNFYHTDNFEGAEARFTKALDLYIELADGKNTARTYYSLGLNYEGKEEFVQAENVYHTSIMFAQQFDEKELEANAWRRLAALQSNPEQYETKLNYSYQALSIYQELGNRPREAEELFYIGMTQFALKNHAQSLNHLLDALTIYREIEDTREEALTLVWISRNLLLLGREIEAEDTMRQALNITHQLGDPEFILEMEDVLDSPGLFDQLTFPDATPTATISLTLTPIPEQDDSFEGYSDPISLILSEVQELYEPLEFEFVPTLNFCDDEQKYPRVTGTNERRGAHITACRLSKNSDQLIEVSIAVTDVFNVGGVEETIKLSYIVELIEFIVPEWEERYGWHYFHYEEARKNTNEVYTAETRYQNLVVTMFAFNEGTGIIFHDISVPTPMP